MVDGSGGAPSGSGGSSNLNGGSSNPNGGSNEAGGVAGSAPTDSGAGSGNEAGAPASNPCSPNPCANDDSCSISGDSYACDPPAFESAGGHFNPTERQHGFLNPAGEHAGDMPNITVRSDGTAAADHHATGLTLSGGANALLDGDGSAIVVHAGVDDYRTDPSGNSGPRIACGVVQR